MPRAQLARRQEAPVSHFPSPPDTQHPEHDPAVFSGLGVGPVRLGDHKAHLLHLPGVQHRPCHAAALFPVAVRVPQPLLQVDQHLFQLDDVLGAVLQLRLENPLPSTAVLARRQRADLRAHDERRLADELVQLPERARLARRLRGLVVAHRHREDVVALLLQVEVDNPLERLPGLEVGALALRSIGRWVCGRELQLLHRAALPGRLHLGLDAHIADDLALRARRRLERVVVRAEGAAEDLADVGGAEAQGQVEDRGEEEGGGVRRGGGVVGERGRGRGCGDVGGRERRANRVLDY